MGEWVGGWVEEIEAVRMRCWGLGLGGWVGGWVGGRRQYVPVRPPAL